MQGVLCMRFATKTYVVLQRLNIPAPDGANRRVLGAYLTQRKAQAVVDAMPGTYIEKHMATK